ncbi:mechanosensitive ion channel family protein [Corynebacterium alimapuense]|uniref:Mechanosensitive ion channel MscS domain-containing protein n=1 Tax=Corynebacterium alimapuense TaxID=1576874 RepID=A0A3M8K819_9CORY|nr:mechanosensitive ion channel domain-containing protein [Corynebacterium alimapuense]RNE48664.1 hypothetical protein C5L39_07500 [Corynebacterium alimapuense]
MLVSFWLNWLNRTWDWFISTGLTLALLLVLALLIPRLGRFAQRWINRRLQDSHDPEDAKTKLAMVGVGIYIAQLIGFFILAIVTLSTLGVSLAGVAIPATVASAAIGLGAQSIIADFLAGFFILTEKQFGVGDWVRFEGNGVVVEGTVIQVTMRATRIRTLAEETVIIPNSTARVCINSSNFWSRAVVVIPVPLLGSQDPYEAIERSEAATRRAIERDYVAAEVIGELDVQPAVGINPPSTVGMPWTVDMRFLIQVQAGSQWLVERAIRTAILEEFWDEYGSATTVTGEVKDSVDLVDTAEAIAKIVDDPRNTARRSTHPDATAATTAAASAASAEANSTTQSASTEDRTREDSSDMHFAVPAQFSDGAGHDPAANRRRLQIDGPEPTAPKAPDAVDPDGDEITEEEELLASGQLFRSDEVTTRWQRMISAGGRIRPSTMYLFIVLFVIVFAKGLTAEPDTSYEGWGSRSSSDDVVISEEVEPEPTVNTNPSSPATPTQEPVPTTTTTSPSFSEQSPRNAIEEGTETTTTQTAPQTTQTTPTQTPAQATQETVVPTSTPGQ